MGGFAFENGNAVKEWLDFIIGRNTGPSNPRLVGDRRGRGPAHASGGAGGSGGGRKNVQLDQVRWLYGVWLLTI